MSPNLLKVEAAVIDLCAQIETQMGALRRDYQISIYEVCLGLQNRITKEMGNMVYHIRRLIDQNGFLYDRVMALEKRYDTEKVLRGNRDIHDPKEGERLLHSGSPKNMDEVRRSVPRRRISGGYRQAG